MENLKLGGGGKRVPLFYKWWSGKGLLEGCISPVTGKSKRSQPVVVGEKLLGGTTVSIKAL